MKKLALVAILFSNFPILSAPLEAPRVRAEIQKHDYLRRGLTLNEQSIYRNRCKKHSPSYSLQKCHDQRYYTYDVYRLLTTANESHKEEISQFVLANENLNYALSVVHEFAGDNETKGLISDLKRVDNITSDVIINMQYREINDNLSITIKAGSKEIVSLYNDDVSDIASLRDMKRAILQYVLEKRQKIERKNTTDSILNDFSNIEEENENRFI